MEKTVKQRYSTISEGLFFELAEDNEYWGKAYKFWSDVKDKPLSSLRTNQLSWMGKIEKDLQDECKTG